MRSHLRKRSLSLWLALSSTAVMAARLPAAYAQSDTPSAPSASAEQGRSARAQGRFAEAIDAYARAYLESGDPNILFELGECQRSAGRDADAIRSFQNYLRRAPRGPHHRSAEQQLKELQILASRPPSSAAAAPVMPPPAVAPVAPAAPVNAVAPPPVVPPPPPAAPPAQREMPAPPAAVPTVPMAAVAATPGAISSPPAVDLTATAPAPVATPPLQRWVPWSLAAATVALAGVAVWSGLSANERFNELQQSCGKTPQGCDDAATGDLKDRARRANVLWALTAVAAVGTGVTIYVNTSAAGVSGLWRY